MAKSRSYQEELIGYLQDSDRAVAYLNAALEEGDSELFLLALQNVAIARGKTITPTNNICVSGAEQVNGELHQFLTLLKDLRLGLTFMKALP